MEEWRLQPAQDFGLPPQERLRNLRRESGLISVVSQWMWWTASTAYLRLYHRLRIDGRANVPPEGPFIMIANHASMLDALILAAPFGLRLRERVFPIAAGDTFFETPGRTLFAAACINALPMWRKNCGPHALDTLRRRLVEEKCIYVLFPEGTRSRDGRLLPFKAGLGRLTAGTDVPVVPCHISGAWEAAPPGSHIPRPRPIRLRIGSPMRFSQEPDDRSGWNRVVAAAEEAVLALGQTARNG